MPNKRVESWFVEEARRVSSIIPAGALTESECPDFLIQTNFGTLGIEVTQLFQPQAASAFPPRQAEKFHDKVVREAENLYARSGSRPLDIMAYFNFNDGGARDHTQMAECLANFVQSHYADQEEAVKGYKFPDVPPGISSVRIARHLDGKTSRWQAGRFGQTIVLNYPFLAQTISRKNGLVEQYRERAKRVWLLIVSDFLPASGSFSIPNEIAEWKFDFDFDKVLLWSREDSKVFELSRH